MDGKLVSTVGSNELKVGPGAGDVAEAGEGAWVCPWVGETQFSRIRANAPTAEAVTECLLGASGRPWFMTACDTAVLGELTAKGRVRQEIQ